MTAHTRLARLVGFDNDILSEVDDAIAELFAGGRNNEILVVEDGYVIAPDDPSSIQASNPVEDVDVSITLPTVFNDRPTFWIKQSGNGHLVISTARASALRAGSSHETVLIVVAGENDVFGFTPAGGSLITYTVEPGVYENMHDLLDAAEPDAGDHFLELVNLSGEPCPQSVRVDRAAVGWRDVDPVGVVHAARDARHCGSARRGPHVVERQRPHPLDRLNAVASSSSPTKELLRGADR